jgi:aspartyl-tRNA(Asn)/glutamyl-tRNA(Gln) amidotransferase subunit B
VVQGGSLSCVVQPKQGAAYLKNVALTRAHLEEDAGKSLHEAYAGMSGIDLNRAGTPLLEIVTEPEMRSSTEALAYAKALHALVMWLDICDGNLQEASFRCDANVSVRPFGQEKLGTRREIKNLNSFRFLQQAIDYEVQWQIAEIEDGRAIRQATVLFDAERGETREMRSKEDAMDYRYFPDPDLLPLEISQAWIAQVKSGLPELPSALRERWVRDYGLTEYDAQTLTASQALAAYYQATLAALQTQASHADIKTLAKSAANWVMGEVTAALNEQELSIEQVPVSSAQLATVIARVLDHTIHHKTAKEVLAALWQGEAESADVVIEQRGLRQMTDSGAIEKLIAQVLAAHPGPVAEFKAGKEKAFNSLVGQAMKATQGKANPQQVNEILRRLLTT